jgi:thiamine biosynthesis lipoprotein
MREALLAGALLLAQACATVTPPAPAPALAAATAEVVSQEGLAMGTSVLFMAFTRDPVAARRAFGEAFAAVHRVEELMTTWEHPGWPRSEVMRINDAAGHEAVPVSVETWEVISAAQALSEASGGAFDITFGVMGGLWRFDEDLAPVLPPADEIARRRALIDYRDVILDAGRRTVKLRREGMRINLGGIAKGYAVDRAVALLRGAGLRDFLVQAGGDLYVAGRKGDAPWRVGIRDPRDPSPEGYFATAGIEDHAFSTAGDYERGFVLEGKRYHHILDPATGYPATACRSVTLFAPTALQADGLDDVVFILGPERGLALVDATPGVGAVIVDAANKIWISRHLTDRIQVLHPPSP